MTVRTNLVRLVGGATEETIIARVGEGIVSSIGSGRTSTSTSGFIPSARVILFASGWPIACASVIMPASIIPTSGY